MPKPCAMPWVGAVFPAPRPPSNRMRSPGWPSCPNRSPIRRVARWFRLTSSAPSLGGSCHAVGCPGIKQVSRQCRLCRPPACRRRNVHHTTLPQSCSARRAKRCRVAHRLFAGGTGVLSGSGWRDVGRARWPWHQATRPVGLRPNGLNLGSARRDLLIERTQPAHQPHQWLLRKLTTALHVQRHARELLKERTALTLLQLHVMLAGIDAAQAISFPGSPIGGLGGETLRRFHEILHMRSLLLDCPPM